MPFLKSISRNQLKTLFGFLFTITISVIAVVYLKHHLGEFEQLIIALGLLGPLISILIYGLAALSPLTTDPLSVVNSLVYGPIFGTIITVIGNTVAAGVEYFFGHHLGQTATAQHYLIKLPAKLRHLPISSPWVLIGGRLIPGYGTKVVSILAGIYQVPLRRFVWTTCLTNFIGAVLITLGANLLRLIV